MLRYSKTLSLALLFSLPAVAMENNQQLQVVETSQEAANSTPSSELLSTTLATGTYEEQQSRLTQIAKVRQGLDKKEEATREARNKALEDLLAKKKFKEDALQGAKITGETLAAQLLAIQKDRDEKAKALASEKDKSINEITLTTDKKVKELATHKERTIKALIAAAEQKIKDDIAKKESEMATLTATAEKNKKEIITQKDKQISEVTTEADKKIKELTAQKEKASAAQKEAEAALKTIKDTIEKADKKEEAPKKSSTWFTLWSA